MSMRMRSRRGFTLLEVLVALAILAIALAAVIKGVSGHSANAAYLRDRMFAHWVALNHMAEIRLGLVSLERAQDTGKEEMGSHVWYWKTVVTKTVDQDLRQVTIEVKAAQEDESALTQLVSFIDRPATGLGVTR